MKVEDSSKNSVAGSNQIVAPMVGTVYLQPEPGARPYVEPGKMVHAGDVVCVIEAMKMLTEVKSNVTGQMKNILVENVDKQIDTIKQNDLTNKIEKLIVEVYEIVERKKMNG